jgi:hypothetical protein
MTSIDNGADIPASSRLSQVGQEILAEEARRTLADDSVQPKLKLNLAPPAATYGPEAPTQPLNAASKTDEVPPVNQVKILPGPFADNDQRLSDRLADSVHPGLGRIESQDLNSNWRLDYVDAGRCKSKASVGMCFTFDWR